MTSTKMQGKDMTFRVRGVPTDWGQDRLESCLAEQDTNAGPTVQSLTPETHGRSSSATVTFQCEPGPLQDLSNGKTTWDICVRNRPGARPEYLSLDTDFFGMTTLFPPDHKVDVIAVSGLGGHAFGYLNQKGSDYM